LARKILLADDSVTAQNMGRKILADAGYEVITVNNGSAALKKIAELKPEIIILDVYMPGYSGLEVCQRLKEAQETSRIPVLLTVGKLEPFKPEEAKRVRAEGYIVKPFEASELLSTLSKLEDKIVPRAEASKPGRFARANAALSGMADKPIRWMTDDATKFIAREVRRGRRYDGILLDPPKFGRGPEGEVWRLEEGLPGLIADCRKLLDTDSRFLFLTVYAVRMSALAIGELLSQGLNFLCTHCDFSISPFSPI